MKCTATAIACLTIAAAGSVAAETPFDGLYYPAGADGWSCDPSEIGMELGSLSVKDDALWAVENTCELRNPTSVKGMGGILYEAVCSGEGSQYSYRLMLLSADAGIYLIEDGFVAEWALCG